MSSELDDVARSLFNGQIPFIWRRLAPETLKSLGNWIIHYQHRYKQYNGWVSHFLFLHFKDILLLTGNKQILNGSKHEFCSIGRIE